MKINNKKYLPKSFDLNKYDDLGNLSDKDLFRQLYWRIDYLTDGLTNYPDYYLQFGAKLTCQHHIGDPFYEIVNNDCFLLEKGNKNKQKTLPRLIGMSFGDGIRSLKRFDVNMISDMVSDCGYLKRSRIYLDEKYCNELIEEDNGKFWAVMQEPVNILADITDEAMVCIDLNLRDEVLIDSFAKLLPLWRKELDMPEPDKPVSGGWDSVRRKIIEYKIIPLADLLSWESATESKIALGVLAVALFPNGEKDAFAIAQTVKPFLDKIMTHESLDKMMKEISNN